ncbi:hypothetical protein NDU88_002347 [Pleurodeles waltl]|uniref:Uncharacterized protein n=1 Tax=Pleurodeles waltl TaxID=8319 RepID=A0AAV7M184_PLEWA|nr:hypothetical protein NDU88_002347 [Pleurodeles waltl]
MARAGNTHKMTENKRTSNSTPRSQTLKQKRKWAEEGNTRGALPLPQPKGKTKPPGKRTKSMSTKHPRKDSKPPHRQSENSQQSRPASTHQNAHCQPNEDQQQGESDKKKPQKTRNQSPPLRGKKRLRRTAQNLSQESRSAEVSQRPTEGGTGRATEGPEQTAPQQPPLESRRENPSKPDRRRKRKTIANGERRQRGGKAQQ